MSKKKQPTPTKGTPSATGKTVAPPPQNLEPKTIAKPNKGGAWGGWLLFVLAFVLYGNTLTHQFAFDDSIVIVDNQFTQKGMAGVGELMTRDFFEGIYGEGGMELSGGRYRPLSLVSFAIENQLFGTPKKLPNGELVKDAKGHQLYDYNPFVGHFLNVFLFALSALLLYRLLRLWFDKENEASVIPFIAGLIFVAHPIHTEVVANIKSRDEILALLLLISTFLSLHLYVRKASPLRLGLGVLAYFGAMLSKENAFTFIVIFPFTLYLFEKESPWSKIALNTAPYWVTAVLYFALRSSMVGGIAAETNKDIMENPFYGVAIGEKLGTIAYILWKYLQLLVLPHPLSSDYSREQIPLVGFGNPFAILGLLAHLAMAAWVLMRLWKRDVFALCMLIYFIPLSLTINLLFNIGAPMAERFLYLPSVGFSIALAYGLSLIFKTKELNQIFNKPALLGVTAILCIGFSLKTITRNLDWKDNETLFTADVKNSPRSAKMNYYYANTVFKKYLDLKTPTPADTALLSIAEKHFTKAAEIYPKFHTAIYNQGFVEVLRKNGKKAEAYFLKTLELQPGHLNSIEQLGRVYGELLQDLPKAEQYLKQAVLINTQRGATSQLASNYQNLGIVYSMQQKNEDAIKSYLEAIRLMPTEPNSYMNLGYTYKQMGNEAEAQKYLEKAYQLNPALRK